MIYCETDLVAFTSITMTAHFGLSHSECWELKMVLLLASRIMYLKVITALETKSWGMAAIWFQN